MRRNNPEEMTIMEQLEAIKEEVCDKLCRYPDMVEDGTMNEEYFKIECEYHCPLRKLNINGGKR